jgi:hypothetical protein
VGEHKQLAEASDELALYQVGGQFRAQAVNILKTPPERALSAEERMVYEQDGDTAETTLIDSISDVLRMKVNPVDKAIKLILPALASRADFYREGGTEESLHPRIYLRMKDTSRILNLLEAEHLNDLLTGYGLHLKSFAVQTVAAHVCQRVRLIGAPITVCRGAHYDPASYTLRIALDALRVLKITPESVDLIGNVEDGLLFLPGGDPIQVDLDAVRGCKLGNVRRSRLAYVRHLRRQLRRRRDHGRPLPPARLQPHPGLVLRGAA